jgi:hypothetical protein
MGEAKWRKANDPLYGKVPKKGYVRFSHMESSGVTADVSPAVPMEAHERGLIVSPPMTIENGDVLLHSSWLDPQELRFALLFWDRLVWPLSRDGISLGSYPDAQYIERAGILERPVYSATRGDAAHSLLTTQIEAFKSREASAPGSWALSMGKNSLQVVGYEDMFGPVDTTSVELHRAVPIPRANVPLADILEFRMRRKAELQALRTHLDGFAAEIGAAGSEVTLQARIKEIDQACANLAAVGKEFQLPFELSNFKASVNFGFGPFTAAYGGWEFGHKFGLPAAATALAAAVGGAAALISLKRDIVGLRSVRAPKSPYRYAFHADRELR